MRITKKIISLVLVMSMIASFFAMTGGFPLTASAYESAKTQDDFGLKFDSNGKFKILQINDIQTKTDDGDIFGTSNEYSIPDKTRDTIAMAIERYKPDLIMLGGDQIDNSGDWEDALGDVFGIVIDPLNAQGLTDTKITAVFGNHDYKEDVNDQWEWYNTNTSGRFLNYDNNYAGVYADGDLEGVGNGVIPILAQDGSVAFNLVLFDSQADYGDCYNRPGGSSAAGYNELINWYKNMTAGFASKGTITKRTNTTTNVPTLILQHIILQDIYREELGILESCAITDDGAVAAKPERYSHVDEYGAPVQAWRLNPNWPHTGTMGEPPGATDDDLGTTELYNAVVGLGNCVGWTFAHDHDNDFSATDANGLTWYYGDGTSWENYLADKNPGVRYFELTLDDATGQVDVESETRTYSDMTIPELTDVASDRMEAINGNGDQMVNTFSVPKTVVVGDPNNSLAQQKFGTAVQEKLLDYSQKAMYTQDLEVKAVVPKGASVTYFAAACNGVTVTFDTAVPSSTTEGDMYTTRVTPGQNLTAGETIVYTLKYIADGIEYEIHNTSMVEDIKQPAAYGMTLSAWRNKSLIGDQNPVQLAYVSTLWGKNAFSRARTSATTLTGDYTTNSLNVNNAYYDYTLTVDHEAAVHGMSDQRYVLWYTSMNRLERSDGYRVDSRYMPAGSTPQTDIYVDTSALKAVSATDTRLDLGVSIDYWVQKEAANMQNVFVAGIGFHAGDKGYNWADWNTAIKTEVDSLEGGISTSGAYAFNSYAANQSLSGVSTTHVNGHVSSGTDITMLGLTPGSKIGWKLTSASATSLPADGLGITMYSGVRGYGQSNSKQIIPYAIDPFYLVFHVHDKSALRELSFGEMMNPRFRTDYPNASDEIWNEYIAAYQAALSCYAQVNVEQTTIDATLSRLNNAIARLLDSNKVADDSLKLSGKSKFESVDVPPILYVGGISNVGAYTTGVTYYSATQIRNTAPFTDVEVTVKVPTGASNVNVVAINNDANETLNGNVSIPGSQNGTTWTGTVSGNATAGTQVYYKITYTINGKEYQTYAASYVKTAPIYKGMFTHRVRNTYKGTWGNKPAAWMYVSTDLTAESVFNVRGASAILSLFPVQKSTDSFSDTVVNRTYTYENGNNLYSSDTGGEIGWTFGTFTKSSEAGNGESSDYWPNAYKTGDTTGNFVQAGVMTFYSDQQASQNGWNWWNGLVVGEKTSASNNANEYIVVHYYYDPQATDIVSGKTISSNVTYRTHSDSDSLNGFKRGWLNYVPTTRDNRYGDDSYTYGIAAGTGNVLAYPTAGGCLGMEAEWGGSFKGSITDTIQNAFVLKDATPGTAKGATLKLQYFTTVDDGGGGKTRAQQAFSFKYNPVDRSKAHAAITSALNYAYNKNDLKADWWNSYRTELLEAYVKCGNLWDTTDFDPTVLDTLLADPDYKDADYSKLIAAINAATNAGLVPGSSESIADYDALLYKVNSGDDSRYVGQSYDRAMFMNNAADLINIIKGRVAAVYASRASDNNAPTDAAGNVHLAYLDFTYQGIIDKYAEQITNAWNLLRLQAADYTVFDTNYGSKYDADAGTIFFVKGEQAGYANADADRTYANEKNLDVDIFTSATQQTFVNSVTTIDRTLKKPSETMVVNGLPRIYPTNYTYLNGVSNPDQTACYYNTARNAYEALEFRKAHEYYSADGTWSDGTVTYYAYYDSTGASGGYKYVPVFATSADSNREATGYQVIFNKVDPTYKAGNDAFPVLAGDGTQAGTVTYWTVQSWGGTDQYYGFVGQYNAIYTDTSSQYNTTKGNPILALYVESMIMPELAAMDYLYDSLDPNDPDLSQLNLQINTYANYEKGGSEYDALAGYEIVDANGKVLTDGAQWYTDETWTAYIKSKSLPGVPDNAGLAEAQEIINTQTQLIYANRNKLALRTMEDYRVSSANAILGKTDFASINTQAQTYNTEVADKTVGVFASRYTVPQDRTDVEGNSLLFNQHPYYTEAYRTALAGLYSAVTGYAGKPMATNIANYQAAVKSFEAKYNEKDQNLNGADYSTVTMLLNKAWIPTYDQYGTGNYSNGNWLLGSNYSGADWYTADSWTEYYNAREAAAKLYENQTGYDGYQGFSQNYGSTIHTGGLLVDSQGSNATDVEGSINKAAYDLLVAYYKLQYKKVNEFEGTVAGITGTYSTITAALDSKLAAKEQATVDVVIVNQETGLLETVQKSIYDPTAIELAKTLKNTILALENENLAPNYSAYVNAVNNYNSAIDNLAKAPVYQDGWNGIFQYLNANSGDITITDSGTMTAYFNAVYTGFNPAAIYAENGQSINNIFATKALYDGMSGLNAEGNQSAINTLVTNLYNELNSASFVPSQVTRAEETAEEKLSQGTKTAYDPLQLNGRDKVDQISMYTPESVADVRAKIAEIKADTVTLWETNPTVTGYNDNSGTVIDGSLADEIWAAAGLATESAAKDYDGTDRDSRYLLEEGGQFLAALIDALAYAKGELYDDEGNVKTFDVVTGAGETITSTLFTDESVSELETAIAAGDQVTSLTTQDQIDRMVFDILEQTDINNTIKLKTSAGDFYGALENEAEDEGLKYKDADYTYFLEELAAAFEGTTDGANELIAQIWIDNGDGTFTLDNELGAKYFTSDTWTPYYTAYLNATGADRALTAKDQGTINTHTTTVHTTREALTWKGIDDSTQTLIDSIGSQIDSLSTALVTVYTYQNSVASVLEDGTRVLTAPSVGEKQISPYGDVSYITSLWESFRANYLEAEELDITKQAEMLERLTEIQDILSQLETKKFSVEEDNEFTVGVRALVDSFIAGTYTFNGIGSGDGVGTYTSDYLATASTTNVSAAEQLIRDEQQIAIQNKLNAIYTILGSNFEVGDVYIDYSTGVAVRYETALEAVNALTYDLFEYVTTTRAQYAGFALDMRQAMYDFLSTEITVYVDYRYAAATPVYTKNVPLFAEGTLENAQMAIDGTGEDGDYGAFGMVESWPTINQLDSSVGITFDETVPVEELTFQQPVEVDGEVYEETVYVGTEIVGFVNGYSYIYGDSMGAVNNYDASALMWLTTEAVYDTGSEVYILAAPAGDVMISDAQFAYAMDAATKRTDGEWYTEGYGIDIIQDGSSYYLAAGEDPESVTGSSYGGWFTDATYEAVRDQKLASDEFIAYADMSYGTGPVAAEKYAEIESTANDYGICWNTANRDAYVAAVQDDQDDVDAATVAMYKALCELQLLKATDAYREVAGLIYDALGLVPTYSADNNEEIIIVDGTTEENPLGGRVFNISLLGDLDDLSTPDVDYTTVTDEAGNVYYYSTKLPTSYDGGTAAVEYILNTVFAEKLTSMHTIDKAILVNGDTNSVKADIIAELEKLGLGKADLSLITSLTAAFLYNNPSNADSLGSYDIYDNGVGEQFFGTTHPTLGTTGNAFAYRNDLIMQGAGTAYHASGFYDFTKYTDASLRDVIEFLANNDIINVTTEATANNFNAANKTGFDIKFDPGVNGDTLYDTPKTQQATVDNIYKELVTLINALELEKATTTDLVAAIGEGDTVMLDESIYDHEAVDADGNNIWDEFKAALENANNYTDVTVINEVQVAEAEDRLEKAIKALVLYVDTFAPIVTVHNTQSDLNKFYAAHEAELKNTIASADKMVTASYMEPGLGGYTLYVYTNQLNPQIVLSLKDATSALNADGSSRTVTASKPERLTVSAQAMNGVTANVITPVLDAATGTALSSQVVTLSGAVTATAQTAKNANGTYDADSSAYIVLTPQFSDNDGVQQAAAYTINATDSAITKDAETGELSDALNTANQFNYSSNETLIDNTNDGNITVFVYYMNAMPEDGSDDGVNADGSVNASAVLTYNERDGLGADEWNSTYGVIRTFDDSVRSWEFSDINADLNAGAVYYDPTFGENNFGSFVYVLDPKATSGLDYDVAKTYFENGADAAKDAFINALTSNNEYIAAFDAESQNASSAKYLPFGANENWDRHLAFIDNGTLLFVHVADRFGNVCNRIIKVENYDQLAPELTADGEGLATVTEPGGSGISKVDLFEYMGTQGSSLYIDYLFDMLHVEDAENKITYVSEDNSFTIKTGEANRLFTVAVTDNAGNVGSVPVYSDENGDIVLTAVETYDNVAKYAADSSNVEVNTGEDLEMIEFTFNSNQTIILNYGSLSSIVKAGPDGNVFANKKNVPLNIIAKSEVEAIKLYNVDNGTEEIWTADNATITDNGDGTSKWTVKYTFTEGEHNYTATAKVDGEWELFSSDFDFVATTKSIEVKLTVSGIGKIRFGYNDGNYSNVPVMSKKNVPYGSVVTLEAVQTEEGSDFYYWTNNGSNRIISAAGTYEFTAVTNMDLTSQFTTNECFDNDKKLVVYVNNAENVIENFELADGEDYTVPSAPSLPEHVFKEWSMTKEEVLASDEMMIIVRPVYSLVVTNTVTLTEGNWTTTGAGEYQSVDNERAIVSISASATNDDGASFLYWLDAETGDIASYNRSYSFYAIKDTELTPVYGDASAVVPAPVARISTVKYDDESGKVNFYAERSIPAGYTLLQTGVIVTKTASIGTDEEAFILDASGVGKGISKSTASNGYYTGAVSATAGTVVYARAYVIYTNADGDIITSYSPISSYQV